MRIEPESLSDYPELSRKLLIQEILELIEDKMRDFTFPPEVKPEKDNYQRIVAPLAEKDKNNEEKEKSLGDKIWGGLEKAATIGGLFQDIIKPFAMPLAQGGSLEEIAKELGSNLGLKIEPISKVVNNVQTDIKSFKADIASLQDWKETFTTRNLFNYFLSNIQSYIIQSKIKPEILQKIFYRIHEILNENYEETIKIIKNTETDFPAIIEIKNSKIYDNDTLCFKFKCPNPSCSTEYDFIILQSSNALLNEVRGVLGKALDPIASPDEVERYINQDEFILTENALTVNGNAYTLNLRNLNEYQLTLLYTQLVFTDVELKDDNIPQVIDNLFTMFFKDKNEFNGCKSCYQTM